MNMTQHTDIAVIGGVAAGPKTAAVLARRLTDRKITIFQREKLISYGTCGLPYFASGDIDSFQELIATSYDTPRDTEFFRCTKGVEVLTETEVTRIDRESRTLTVNCLADGSRQSYTYGTLVLATGATPVPPPFACDTAGNIRSFTRPEDAISFRRAAQTGQIGSVIIIGGGFIGCELAEACAGLWGIETTLVEMQDSLLPYVLDPEMARLVQNEMERQQVAVRLSSQVEKVSAADDGAIVSLKGGETMTADFVFLCLGVRPEVTLAKECGLTLGQTGAILVDSHLRTSDPHIFAGGDCIESTNLISGRKMYLPMGSLANRQGRVIAENIAGNDCEFAAVTGAFLVKVFERNVGAVGLSEKLAARDNIPHRAVWGSFPDKPDYYPESKTIAVKIVYNPQSMQLLGLQAVGEGDVCRRVDVVSALLRQRARVADLLDFEHGYAPPYSEAMDPLYHLAAMIQAQERAGLVFTSPQFTTKPDDCFQWLDVREDFESEAIPIPSIDAHAVVRIPLNELREQLDRLDPRRPVIIVCQRGPRAYQAARLLRHNGFDEVCILGGGAEGADWPKQTKN
jgi:NADPH-dependent 2,4-dienoyl-CoA reductase/sulfur reductase-like enzyme/rhodanese-related sulfurtransferase